MLLHAVGSFFAVMTLSVIFFVPRRFLIHASIAGMLGWVTYIGLMEQIDNEMLAMFTATFFVAVISHIFARFCKSPVTMFLIPGILPLVPGVGMYRIVYYILLEDTRTAGYYFFYVLQMAGMIAIAIFVTDTLVKVLLRSRYLCRQKHSK